MRKVYLHGELGARFGYEFDMEVETAAEAVRALCVNLRGFEQAMRAGEFHVVRGKELDKGRDLDLDLCSSYRLGKAPLHIAPYIAGSKRGGLLKIVLGVALVGAAFLFSGGALAAPIAGGALGGVTYGNMAILGVALAVSGVSQMLAPEEKKEKNEDSYLLSGPGNTYEQGGALPLVYGEVITGGVLVSAGVDIEQLGN
ncbi:tail assembly protein I [Rhizobium phage RHph_N1_15]|nr:tail assembly protein I [Rhizobium phage RHph_N1_10]QIG69257.1 tail assembly protein I [Rhizobium phage RHph_N1_15]QIG75117.1 tail assembly protein I [Rhizobium phage RHph_N2_6]